MSKFLRFGHPLVAAALALASAWHLAALAIPSFAAIAYPPSYPAWRHLTFVLINLIFAGLFLRRPPWLVWPSTILAIQVLHSHGTAIWTWWRQRNQIDWISIFTVFVALVAMVIAVHDWRNRPSAIREIARNKE